MSLKKFFNPFFGSSEADAKKLAELKEREEEDRKTNQKILGELKDVVKSLQIQQSELKELVKDQINKPSKVEEKETKEDKKMSKILSKVSDMDAELKKYRSMALDSKSMSNNYNIPPANIGTNNSFPGWSPNGSNKTIPAWQQRETISRSNGSSESNSSPSFDDPFSKMKEREKQNISNSNIETESTRNSSFGDEPKPKGMQQVMDLLASGKTPDDIKDIDDTPLNSNSEKIERGSKEPRKKPWEKEREKEDQQRVTEISSN